MSYKLSFNPKYAPPSKEVLEKLEQSQREVENMKMRMLRCPICNFFIEGVYADGIGHLKIKCAKCKFEGVLNLAYFRRQKVSRNCIRWRGTSKLSR